ncbi:Mitochondrial inner membrane protein [Aphelenchoides bicaudatus]|nr:Mitochondrial inner membrane protein [Aphelenchoides bicaudatus]
MSPLKPALHNLEGFGKKLVGLTLVTGAAAGGTIAYAYKDPEFRQTIESYVPQTKELFKSVIGPAEVTYPVQLTPKIQKPLIDEKIRRRDADEKAKIEAELRRVKELSNSDIESQLRDYRQTLDVQYENRIRQTESLHADNLERVVKTLKQVHDAESVQAVEEAVSKERRLHSKQINMALEKLRGMEVALEGRAEMDNENRFAKHFWLACQNLSESIVYGQKAGRDYDQRRKPLENEINVITKACEGDQFVSTIAQHFSPAALKNGVYTQEDLQDRFKKVYKLAVRTASIDENGGGLLKYASSWLQSLFIVDWPRAYSEEDTVSLTKLNNHEIITRANYFVNKGDFLSAVRVTQLLRGEPANIASDWIKDARSHLEARFLADLLLTHSAASGIRTIY